MKVEKGKSRGKVAFGSIAQGETFKWNDEHYIKADNDQDDDGRATCLEDGMVVLFGDDEEVVPINAKVVILEG